MWCMYIRPRKSRRKLFCSFLFSIFIFSAFFFIWKFHVVCCSFDSCRCRRRHRLPKTKLFTYNSPNLLSSSLFSGCCFRFRFWYCSCSRYQLTSLIVWNATKMRPLFGSSNWQLPQVLQHFHFQHFQHFQHLNNVFPIALAGVFAKVLCSLRCPADFCDFCSVSVFEMLSKIISQCLI